MPTGSMRKFFADQGGDAHGGNLIWPGTSMGFPVRGDAGADLTQGEFDKLEHVLDYKSDLFKLWIPEEKTRFDQINDRILNGWYLSRKRFDYWSTDPLGLVVWLEWAQIYGEIPDGKQPGDPAFDLPDAALFRPGAASPR